MANGLQGRSKPASNTATTVFTATTPIVVTLNATNCSASNADVATISVAPSGVTPGDEHRIESATDLPAKGVIERTGIVLNTGDFVQVLSGSGYVAFNVWGVEL